MNNTSLMICNEVVSSINEDLADLLVEYELPGLYLIASGWEHGIFWLEEPLWDSENGPNFDEPEDEFDNLEDFVRHRLSVWFEGFARMAEVIKPVVREEPNETIVAERWPEALFWLDEFDHVDMQRSIRQNIDAWERSGQFPEGRCRGYVLDVMRAHPLNSIDSMHVHTAYIQWKSKQEQQ